jgi:ubiquinone/menaquinone biosynthesis C-methylase UbiE
MTLAAEYRQQFGWRSWNLILQQLPLRSGQTVLDMGCGIGDQARELGARGCKVIGLDANEELINEATSAKPINCEFRTCDLRDVSELGIRADGIWCSFAAAYFTNLPELLRQWAQFLETGGWIAITEIDDLFGHEPLSIRTRSLLQDYAEDALAGARHDFSMGGKLQEYLTQAGFAVLRVLTLPDQELSFRGPATPEVVVAWRKRFERMTLLQKFCASEFENVREEFFSCLTRSDHLSTAKVVSCIASKRG